MALSTQDLVIGLLQSLVAAVFFGSCFVMIKKRKPGDGVFVQWVMSAGILTAGFCILPFQGFPAFHPVATLGGALWSIGNALIIPIIHELGMGPAFLLPDTLNCLLNFSIGYWGLFWTIPRPPNTPWLAFLGLLLILCGGAAISQVKNKKHAIPAIAHPTAIIVIEEEMEESLSFPEKQEADSNQTFSSLRKLIQKLRRPLFIVLAISVGFFYAICGTVPIAVQDRPEIFGFTDSNDRIALVFSHFSGIFLMSTAIFLGYAVCRKNQPYINPGIFLPSFAGGMIWAGGMVFWFLSTSKLSQSITGPVVAVVVGCIAAFWSVFYFKEIESGRSMYMLGASLFFATTGSLSMGLSKYERFDN